MKFTSLYITLVGTTSIYAKTTTARLGIKVLHAVGLDWLLAADEATPQKFIADMTSRVPDSYAKASPESQLRMRNRLALAGKRGWFYEEFGQKLAAIVNERGSMAEYRGLLRLLYDCPPRYEYGTISRGDDVIELPYLALLANLTPADMQRTAGRRSGLWHDGFLARFSLVCPPRGALSYARFPLGALEIPSGVTMPLRQWHQRLGMPDVTVTSCLDEHGKATGEFSAEISNFHPKVISYGDGVYGAFYNYKDSLDTIIAKVESNSDLHGNLSRLPEMAIRIAVLLGSLENGDVVEMRHWARGQAIAERWREGWYRLHAQVNGHSESQGRSDEQKVLRIITKKFDGRATAAEIARYVHGLDSAAVTLICSTLCSQGLLKAVPENGTVYYGLA